MVIGGSCITAFESWWGDGEAGCLFYDVSEDCYDKNDIIQFIGKKTVIYQNYKIRVSLSIFE